MNKYGFCLSTSKKHVILDDIAQHFLDRAVHLVKAGKKFVYVVDNIDWEEKVHDMRQDYQNKSVHAVATSIVFSRVSSNQLPDNGPQKDIQKCNVREVVSMSAEELKDIQHRYRMFVARLLIEKFSELASLNSLFVSEIELKHEHSDVTANKSEIMTLPILMKDEKKYSDCVDMLDQLEEWTHDIYKASGLYNETKSPATSGSVHDEYQYNLRNKCFFRLPKCKTNCFKNTFMIASASLLANLISHQIICIVLYKFICNFRLL